ncbi:MAG: hypothetical protein GY762_18340 [Proteobacteria bacterium]|nr:hypothetical protein [Pseudomonadota bacterium]
MREIHPILFAAVLLLALGCQSAEKENAAQNVHGSLADPSSVAAETPASETPVPATASTDSGCPYARQLKAEGGECPYMKKMKADKGECPYAKMKAEGKECPCSGMKAAKGECPYAKMKAEGKEGSCPGMKAAKGECPYAKMKAEEKGCPYAKMRAGDDSAATETTP